MSIIYLYVKQCKHCTLQYFGVSHKSNPFRYQGSGEYWTKHLNKHKCGYTTIDIWGFDNQEMCMEFATKFSHDNNIVESKKWANLKVETGIRRDLYVVTGDHKLKISKAGKGRTLSKEHKDKIGHALRGKPVSDQTRKNMSKAKQNNPNVRLACKKALAAAIITNTGRKRPEHSLCIQQLSRSKYIVITPHGSFKCLTDCCKELGIDFSVLKSYINGKIVTPMMESKSKFFLDEHIGKNTNGLGWIQVDIALP